MGANQCQLVPCRLRWCLSRATAALLSVEAWTSGIILFDTHTAAESTPKLVPPAFRAAGAKIWDGFQCGVRGGRVENNVAHTLYSILYTLYCIYFILLYPILYTIYYVLYTLYYTPYVVTSIDTTVVYCILLFLMLSHCVVLCGVESHRVAQRLVL